jgi:hypothetical protein
MKLMYILITFFFFFNLESSFTLISLPEKGDSYTLDYDTEAA